MPPAEEPFVPFAVPRERVPPCTNIRSTLVGSSILSLKKTGVFDRYLTHLPAEHHEKVLYGVAGQWLPIAIGRAHYGACEAMGLATEEILAVGASVAALSQKAMFSFVLRVATESGVTPWTAISKCQVFWERSYVGSAIGAFKLGPKEARLEVVNNSLAEYAYWRCSFGGIVRTLLGAFCLKAFVRELPRRNAEPHGVAYRCSWV